MTRVTETAEFWDAQAAHYDGAYDADGRGGRVLRARQDAVLGLLGESPGRVLDAGMGPGRLLIALSGRGWTVSGVDTSERMVAMAVERLPDARERLLRASVERLPFPDSSFDAVVATGVLEYVGYSDSAISELTRVLRPGGRAVLSVPDLGPLDRLWRRGVVYPLARTVKRVVPFGRPPPLWRPPSPGRRFGSKLAAAGLAVEGRARLRSEHQLLYLARRQEVESGRGRSGDRPGAEPEVPDDYYRRIHEVEEKNGWHRGMREISDALLDGELTRGGRLLDVGCGTGGFLSWALGRGSFERVAGVDISAKAVALARKRVPVAELSVATIWELPFDAASFDLIVLNDVLQHVPDAEVERALIELKRVLRPGGSLLIRTNGSRHGWSQGDWRVYDRAMLRASLEGAGFRCRRMTFANLVGSLWATVRGRAPRAPNRERHGIPRRLSGRMNTLTYWLLHAEAKCLRHSPVGLPYGHTLFALARPAEQGRSNGNLPASAESEQHQGRRIQEAVEQMPGRLARIDDSRGIAWRLRNLARRVTPRFALRFIYGYLRGVRFERPVFIIGAPRSGTSMVFELLKSSRALDGLPWEGHDVWRAFHHPRWSGWRSDAVGPGRVRFGERRFVNAYFYAYLGSCRLVEKTPENALRVPYLLELFPDATFVAVRRNPCEVISSIINGWRDPGGRFRTYYVPADLRIPGRADPHMWCFALIEGWRDYVAQPVSEIAFAQWDQLTRAVEEARSLTSSAQWLDVSLEDLIARPERSLSEICSGLGIEAEPAMIAKLGELRARPINALSSPDRATWQLDNGQELQALLPLISRRAADRGYEVDPETGACRLVR